MANEAKIAMMMELKKLLETYGTGHVLDALNAATENLLGCAPSVEAEKPIMEASKAFARVKRAVVLLEENLGADLAGSLEVLIDCEEES